MHKIKIHHAQLAQNLNVELPASKSISNRLLMLQFTANNNLIINNLSNSEDTLIFASQLSKIRHCSPDSITNINVGNCGAAYRFLCSCLANIKGKWILEGNEQLSHRPIEPLITDLQAVGANVQCLQKYPHPILQIEGKNLNFNNIHVNTSLSSQYLSSILLSLPLVGQDIVVNFEQPTLSQQYVEMTIKLMQQIGIQIVRKENLIFYKHSSFLAPQTVVVEQDWSAAAVWFVWVALSKNAKVQIKGLQKSDIQKDNIIADHVEPFGVKTTYTSQGVAICKISAQQPSQLLLDCANNPDLVPYLAVLCAGSRTPAIFYNVDNLAFKESNRIESMQKNLSLWADIKHDNHCLRLSPTTKSIPQTVEFQTFNDHRMAMAFSALSQKCSQIVINNPNCVKKSYPTFWAELSKKIEIPCKK
ncbi:MAG: hypothetical protein LBR36_06560 [Bacteroidales bacterium]|jgi:3-phosphoshikimate 1-carboxyvinyltransferase|nr:hypothetical protein [Bacteroidales bacterium]